MTVTVNGTTFTPKPDCNNCDGTGVFDGYECCHFCLSDAIRAGELDGVADDVRYVGGKQVGPCNPSEDAAIAISRTYVD